MLDIFRQGAPVQETALLDTARRLRNLRKGRVAVHIHLSKLAAFNRRDHHLRIATDLFISCVSHMDGQLFVLENNDIVFIAKNASQYALDNAVNRLRVLFSEDPLAQFRDTENEQPRFCSWYNLEKDYPDFLMLAQQLVLEAERSRNESVVRQEKTVGQALVPISPEILSRLDKSLGMADLSTFIQRQTVCFLAGHMSPEPLFDELYVSIDYLRNSLAPGIDLSSNRWLFHYMTYTLDKRVMYSLMRDGTGRDMPFSINLNVATVLSPEFSRFEMTIAPRLRGRLVIEMNKIDVFSDMGAFLFARDYLHERGFRICLDGLTHHTLPYYDRSRLGFDLIKIFWTPGGIDEMKRESLPEVRSIIMEAGQARTILCRCDSARAIEIGQSLGITMFQGRHVDRLLQHQTSRPEAQ